MIKIDFKFPPTIVTSCLLAVFLLFGACKKKEEKVEEPVEETPVVTPSPLATVSTLSVTGVGEFSAVCSGKVSSEGNSAVTMVGICWDVNPAPTTLRNRTYVGAGTGTFTSVMDSLKANTKYYVRAYATNFSGTAYGNEMSFKTAAIWEDKSPTYISSQDGCILLSGNALFVGGTGGIWRSDDNAETWTPSNTGLSNTNVKCLFMKGNTLFAGTQGGVFVSNDMGGTWSSSNSGLTNFNIVQLVLKGSSIYAATSSGVFVSTNNGGNWSKLNGLTLSYVDNIVVMENNIYAASIYLNDDIYMSSDDGATWNSFSSFFAQKTLNDLSAIPSKLFAASNDGFYVYDNGNWNKLLSSSRFECVKTKDNMILTSSTYLKTLYRSTDSGSTFNKLATTSFLINDMEMNDDYVFALQGLSVFRLPLK